MAQWSAKEARRLGLEDKIEICPHPLRHINATRKYDHGSFDIVLCDGSIDPDKMNDMGAALSLLVSHGRFVWIGGLGDPGELIRKIEDYGLLCIDNMVHEYRRSEGPSVIETKASFTRP